jgi:hypothetical protein
MLDVGSVTDSVEVSAQTAMLQSESVERSATISGKQIENIETNGRNPLDMAKLVPGVSFTNGTSYGDLDPGRLTRYSYRARPRLEQRSAMRRLLRVADDTPLA